MMVVFCAFAFVERTNPDVIRLTANSGDSALPVAIPCNDALFVLLLLFMIFSNWRSPNANAWLFGLHRDWEHRVSGENSLVELFWRVLPDGSLTFSGLAGLKSSVRTAAARKPIGSERDNLSSLHSSSITNGRLGLFRLDCCDLGVPHPEAGRFWGALTVAR
jgi:hypothetical protein